MNKRWKNFNELDFAMAVPSCSLSSMNEGFMNRLQTARDIAGIPFKINSAFRSKEYELSKGRSGSGFHTLGAAVDISCKDSHSRLLIVDALLKAGFTGIGIGPTFIHVDDRVEQLIWLY